jgi:molecular chaperone HscB
MMDINEQLMELEFEPNEELTSSIKESLRLQEEQVYHSVSKYFDMEEFQCNEVGFQLLKDFYYKRKYLQRIQEKI